MAKATSDGDGAGAGALAASAPPERFDEILGRLKDLVGKLEGGNLSLEESLRFFEEGVSLCRRGAEILDGAEKRVEVLLGTAGGVPRTAPFDDPGADE